MEEVYASPAAIPPHPLSKAIQATITAVLAITTDAATRTMRKRKTNATKNHVTPPGLSNPSLHSFIFTTGGAVDAESRGWLKSFKEPLKWESDSNVKRAITRNFSWHFQERISVALLNFNARAATLACANHLAKPNIWGEVATDW